MTQMAVDSNLTSQTAFVRPFAMSAAAIPSLVLRRSRDGAEENFSTETTFDNRLKTIAESVNSLMGRAVEEDFLYEPSKAAIKVFESVVIPAVLANSSSTNPIVAPDGSGGLKFDWRRSFDAEVRLYISGVSTRRSYIYFRFGEEDGVEYELTPQILADSLQRLR